MSTLESDVAWNGILKYERNAFSYVSKTSLFVCSWWKTSQHDLLTDRISWNWLPSQLMMPAIASMHSWAYDIEDYEVCLFMIWSVIKAWPWKHNLSTVITVTWRSSTLTAAQTSPYAAPASLDATNNKWETRISAVNTITETPLDMDHSHMDHGHMGHGDMDHGGMDMGGDSCSMNVRLLAASVVNRLTSTDALQLGHEESVLDFQVVAYSQHYLIATLLGCSHCCDCWLRSIAFRFQIIRESSWYQGWQFTP